jgi:hypothetical protein
VYRKIQFHLDSAEKHICVYTSDAIPRASFISSVLLRKISANAPYNYFNVFFTVINDMSRSNEAKTYIC